VLSVSGAWTAAPPAADVAVVVNSKTPVDSLSMGELQKISRGERQFWTAGQRITLLIRAPVSHERDVLLKRVYQMTEAQYKQYWVAKVFRAEAPSGPKVIYNNQTAVELINGLPGSIAFIDASQVPSGVKVVKIDGRQPGDKDYPLR
jgi:ABC-type phosphate transport system substrate-binding protein